MLIFGKGKCFHVFGCISKKFSENIFWCLEKKKENTNPEKHKPQPRKKSSTTTNPVRRPRRRSRSEIAIDGAISQSVDRDLGSSSLAYIRDLAFDASRDRTVDRDLWHSRRTARSGLWLVFFLNLCFPSSFPNTRKYFPENFLKCNQTPWKHFPFPKISISGKYVFSGKRFTATKHSLNIIQPSKTIMLTNLTWNKGKCFIHYQNWSLSAKNESTIIVLILKTNIKTKAST